jgi:hypothetical protein
MFDGMPSPFILYTEENRPATAGGTDTPSPFNFLPFAFCLLPSSPLHPFIPVGYTPATS